MSWKTFSAIGCTHGDKVSKPDAEEFFKTINDLRPDVRIHLGDFLDLRSFRKRASKKELAESVLPDISAGLAFLKTYRPNALTFGNHDNRLFEAYYEGDGASHDLAEIQIQRIETAARLMRCELFPYKVKAGWYQIGGVGPRFGHGYAHGVGGLRAHALKIGNCIIAHIHRPGHERVDRLDGAEAWSVGGLPDHEEMKYSHRNFASLAWDHSWIYGAVNDRTGNFVVWEIRKIDGKWIAPSRLKL
jgi:hypothetical protein